MTKVFDNQERWWTRRNAFFRRVFYSTIQHYAEAKVVHETNSCEKFYRALTDRSGCSGSNARLVYVSAMDFVADVELAAKAVLTPDQYERFVEVFGSEEAPLYPESRFKRMAERVGAELVRRRIHPVRGYMAPRILKRNAR